MSNINFRRFKYIVLYAGAIMLIAGFLYWLVDLAFNVQTASQNRTTFARLWTAITSREGVVIWTGLIAAFMLATILVERRLDANRDLKWRRRKARMDHKTARLERRKRLPEAQAKALLTARSKGAELHSRATKGADVEDPITEWEEETGRLLRSCVGDERAERFLHAPVSPVAMAGHQASTMFRVGRMNARMDVLNEIIKEYSE